MSDEETTEPVETAPEATKEPEPETTPGLTEEEANKRVEAARKQEKDKLYGEIQSLKEVVTKLNATAVAEQEAKEKAEAEVKAKADAKRQAELTSEQRFAEQMKQFEERLSKEAAERERLEAELADEREHAEVEIYRQQILRSAGDEIISDLVRGNTKSEVENSVAFAKARYQELFQATKRKAEGVRDHMPGPTNPNPAALDEAELQKSITNFEIDPDRYRHDKAYRAEMDQKRKDVLSRVGQAYQQSVGR